MAITNKQSILVGAGVMGLVTVVGLVLSGERTPQVSANGQRCSINWGVGAKPADADIICVMARAEVTAKGMGFIRCDAGTGESGNVLFRVCGTEWDGGAIPNLAEHIEKEMEVVPASLREVLYDGGPQFVAVVRGEADKEWLCACSTGAGNCERRKNDGTWVSANAWPNVIEQGHWRGSNCVRSPCEQTTGTTTYPAACLR